MIVLPDLDLEIRTCPKVLSTSLTHWAFRIENGRDFVPFSVNGKAWHIHHLYQTRPFAKQKSSGMSLRVCFVRDPIERLVSAYANRIARIHRAERQQFDALHRYGLSDEPSLETFIDNLGAYQKHVPTIQHHTAPQVIYLGKDASYYTHVFGMHEIAEFELFIATLTGLKCELPHEQKSSGYWGTLSWSQQWKIKRQYKADYATYGRFMR